MHINITVTSDKFKDISVETYTTSNDVPAFCLRVGSQTVTGMSAAGLREIADVIEEAVQYATKKDW